jgi:molecular chaperone DnaJ
MANNKDYYDILGISKNSSDDEIKKAYRNLAREHHPDVVKDGDKTTAEKRFKEINEAYQVLKDPQKRKMYDQFGHAGVGAGAGNGASGFGGFGGGARSNQWGPFTYAYSSGAGQGGQSQDFDPFDIFEEFFGFRGFGGARKPKKGKNLYYEMHLDFADAVRGLEKTIKIESGEINIKIPAGVRHGTELRFAGKGMPGPEGTPAGDLFITLRVPTPPQFQRVGDNLATAVKIDFVQAVLGDNIDVPVIDSKKSNGIGTAKLKIPAGTQPNSQFVLKGKGMPRFHGRGQGDIIVQVFVEIPKKLSREQKNLLEKFRGL